MYCKRRFPRVLALMLTLAILLGIAPAGAMVESVQATDSDPAAQNVPMLKNGDFENGLEYWDGAASEGATVQTVTDGAYSGTSLLFTAVYANGVKSGIYRCQRLPVSDLEAIRLSAVSKLISGKTKAYVGLWFYDADGNLVPENTGYSIPIATTADWREDVLVQEVPEGAVTVAVEVGNPSNATCTYMVDDIRFEPAELQDNGQVSVFTENFDNFNLVNGKANAKAGPLDWTDNDINNENLVRCYGGDSAVDGYALHLQVGENLWATSPSFVVQAGYGYTVEFMAKKALNNTDCGTGTIIFVDANGSEVGTKSATVGKTLGQWTTESFAGVAPDGAVSAYIRFYCKNADSAYGIDNLTVLETEALPDEEPDVTEPSEVPSGTVLDLKNGSFENGLEYWDGAASEGATVQTVTDGAYSGTSLLFTAETADGVKSGIYRCQTLSAVNVEAIRLSVVSKLISGKTKAYIGLWFYDADGKLVPENTAYSITIATTANWHEDVLIQNVPIGAVTVRVEIGNPSNATCCYIVDDVKVEPHAAVEEDPIETTEPTEPVDYSGYVFYDTFDHFNKVNNKENIKAGPQGWTDSDENNENLVRCYGGDSAYQEYALHFQTNDNLWAQSPSFPVKGGYDYTVEFMAKKSINNTCFTGFIRVIFLDASGNEVGMRVRYVGRTFGKWAQESVITVAPENAVQAYIVFECKTAKGAYGVDNLTVIESEAPSDRDPNATEPDDLPSDTTLAIKNGDFEEGEQYWLGSSSTGGSVSLVTEGAYKGASLLFTAVHSDTDKANNYRAQIVDVGDAKAIQLSAVSRLISGSAKAYIGLWFYDENDNLIPANTAFSIPIGYTEAWQEDVLIQAVPEGAITVKIEFGNNSNVTSTYMVDDVKISRYTGPEENINPPYIPQEPSSGPVQIVDPSELNASLEELDDKGMPIGWRIVGHGKFNMIEADDAPNGKRYAQIQKTEEGGVTLCSPRISCTPGKTYELKVMARDLVGKCYVGIYVYDANGVCLENASKITTTDGSGKWKIYTILTELPDNAAGIEFEAWAASSVKEYTVQIDTVMMQVSEERIKESYVPTPYTYPTVEELMENVTDVYPRIYFTPEEAKEIKLRRFNSQKTKYGWSWNSQYNALIGQADAYLDVTEVSVSMNTGKSILMQISPVLKDPNDEDYDPIYIAASIDEEGNMYELPHTGFGCLITDQLREMMKTWSLAYIMTGKSVYAERAIDFAMQISDWDWWGDYDWTMAKGIQADASVAWMMEGMVAVYDMCHDLLTEEQLQKLERNIIEKGLIPLSKQVAPMDTSNGNMMYCGGILSGFAAIVSVENVEEIYPYLLPGLLTMHNALDIYAYSGNTEGHYYTDYGLKTFMPSVGHLYRTTKMSGIIDHPFFTEILPYWTVMWAAGGTGAHPNYSDSASLAAYMKIPMAVLSKLTNDPLIDGFLCNASGTGSPFNNLVYLNPEPAPEYLKDYSAVVESLGYGALRTGFADQDMLLTLKANDSQMHHNHYDQNSILFALGATWLIQDPGVGSYYYSNRLFWTHEGHSTILVDYNAQMSLGTGSTMQVFNNNLYSYIIGSAPDAYGSDFDGKILQKFDRHAIQVNHEDKAYYVIIDDLLSEKDRIYTWQMYNGARQLFAVDGQEIPELGSAMGNKVSMPIGKNILSVNFIDNEPLLIADTLYKAGDKSAGLTLTASSAAAKAHQFMTLVSVADNFNSNFISFFEILSGERYTLPERNEEGQISWDSSMPIGQEIVKGNMIGTTPCLFFRGNKEGDWIEIPFEIEESGVYEVNLTMGISDGCCSIKATFDGEITSDVIDCSGLPETFVDIPFGEMNLEAGTHTVKLEIVGPGHHKDYAAGWYLINAGGIDLMRVGVEVPVANDLTVTEIIDNEEALAGMVNYIDNKYDFLMWNRTQGAATAGLLNTDAQQASVLGLVDGVITEGFSATNATTATYDGKVLFVADKKVDIVASDTGWQIISDEVQTVQLTAVAPELDYYVTVNGDTVQTRIENGLLTVPINAGETAVVVNVNEPEVIEPTEPKETEPTEAPTEEHTVAPTEPTENPGNDATVWIIAAIAVVLVTVAAFGIFLVRKKRRTE